MGFVKNYILSILVPVISVERLGLFEWRLWVVLSKKALGFSAFTNHPIKPSAQQLVQDLSILGSWLVAEGFEVVAVQGRLYSAPVGEIAPNFLPDLSGGGYSQQNQGGQFVLA